MVRSFKCGGAVWNKKSNYGFSKNKIFEILKLAKIDISSKQLG